MPTGAGHSPTFVSLATSDTAAHRLVTKVYVLATTVAKRLMDGREADNGSGTDKEECSLDSEIHTNSMDGVITLFNYW